MNTLLRPDTDAEFARIVDELTRRGFLAGGLGTAALAALAACSSSGSSGSDGASGDPGARRQVQTVKGPVDVPAKPGRVVAIQPSASATLYDLGLTPIGVYDQGAEYISPRYKQKWQAAPKIGTNGEVDIEKIATLNPDLIIGVDYEWNTKAYDQLSTLAPTVIAPVTSWQDTAKSIADAMNDLDGLTQLEQRLTQRSATIRQTYAAALSRYRWDILQGGFTKGQFWVYGPNTEVGTILAAAGVQFASATTGAADSTDPGPGVRAVSYERIETLSDADVIGFYAGYDGKPNNEGPQLFAQRGFTNLPAAKAERLVAMPDFLPGGYGDALAVLDQLEAGLKTLETS